MGLLGRRQQDEEREGDAVRLNLDDLACPTCGRDLPPWVDRCPDDDTPAVPRAELQDTALPDIPAHLLEGLEDEAAPVDEAAAGSDGGTDEGDGTDDDA